MNNSSDYIYWSELHCSKDALTDNYGWFMQFLLAILAFTCLIGKCVKNIIFDFYT